ncbi:hypothetical protein [Marilutibacter aestuarii]|uniref:Uncharacterized protein n=1 Tax=Marilutibacter aestuarii TaxID=1706195 RepID=A0A507ZQN3_9GAMM|nr:hypothetical protein [Lysobacter aestuarii]TQD39257.1 hypothetical protein FKV25_15660 [Lysobacter aestuarii]
MDRQLATGTVVFMVLAAALYVAGDLLLQALGLDSSLGMAAHLLVPPLALWAARRSGRVTPLSILLASVLLAIAVAWMILRSLDGVVHVTGGAFGWLDLLQRETLLGMGALVIAPQVWLLFFRWLDRRGDGATRLVAGGA